MRCLLLSQSEPISQSKPFSEPSVAKPGVTVDPKHTGMRRMHNWDAGVLGTGSCHRE